MKNNLNMLYTHSSIVLSQEAKTCPFQGQQGEGVALSFLGHQSIIFTTEISQDFSGEGTSTPKSRS